IASTYELGITAGSTGLVDTVSDQAVVLSVNSSGVIEGRTESGGDLVFTLSDDGSGNVTLTQLRAVVHPDATDPNDTVSLADANLVTLSRTDTITDDDGDTNSDTAVLGIGESLVFADDGPSINLETGGDLEALLVDETVLGTPDSVSYAANFAVDGSNTTYGADQAGTITSAYALGITTGSTGLVDTVSDQAVVLSVNAGGVVEGRAGSGGALVFTVAGDGAGGVTLTQYRAVVHPDATDPNDTVSLVGENLVTLTRTDTIVDDDGDAATASAVLGIGTSLVFADDGPSIIIPEATSLSNAAGESVTAGLDSLIPNIDDNVGADQTGTVRFTNVTDGQETEYYSGGEVIRLYLNDDNTVLSGRIDGETGDEIFTVTLQPDGDIMTSGDSYQVELWAQVDNGAGIEFSDLTGTGPAGNPPWKVVESGTDGQDILFTPINETSVNSNSDDVGVGSKHILYTQGLRIDFGDLTVLNKAGTPADPGDNPADYQFEDHNTVSDFSFTIDQVVKTGDSAEIELRAYSANDDQDMGNDPLLNITQIDVYDDSGNLIAEATDTGTIGGIEFDFTGDTASVQGLLQGYQVVTNTEDGYSRLEVMNVGSDKTDGKFSISNLETRVIISGEDIDMSYDILLLDADGDTTDASLSFTLDADDSVSTLSEIITEGDNIDGLLSASDSPTIDPAYVESDGDNEGGEVAVVPDDLAPTAEPPPAI
ncbi:MAG: DUF5801 repeats-in-toxin domain-containing protein, partial [Verrucomicrobiales bacterium]